MTHVADGTQSVPKRGISQNATPLQPACSQNLSSERRTADLVHELHFPSRRNEINFHLLTPTIPETEAVNSHYLHQGYF